MVETSLNFCYHTLMISLPDTIYQKATQALNFLAEKKNGKINKMKAIKLIYLADRLHLRKYGRPIVGDIYWAMKLGPVGSRIKLVAELDIPSNVLAYTKKYIQSADIKKQSFISLKSPDLGVFSKTDIECLESVYNFFGDNDQFELAELTHQYPEWKKHERALRSGKKRLSMKYDDFFAEADKNDPLFSQKKSELEASRELFGESREIKAFFTK